MRRRNTKNASVYQQIAWASRKRLSGLAHDKEIAVCKIER